MTRIYWTEFNSTAPLPERLTIKCTYLFLVQAVLYPLHPRRATSGDRGKRGEMSTPNGPGGGAARAGNPWMNYGQARHAPSMNGAPSQAGAPVVGGVPRHLAVLQQVAHRPLGGQSGQLLAEKGRASTGSAEGRGEAPPPAPGFTSADPQRAAGQPQRAPAGGGGPITKQQLTVLRAQILVFRKMKVRN